MASGFLAGRPFSEEDDFAAAKQLAGACLLWLTCHFTKKLTKTLDKNFCTNDDFQHLSFKQTTDFAVVKTMNLQIIKLRVMKLRLVVYVQLAHLSVVYFAMSDRDAEAARRPANRHCPRVRNFLLSFK